MIKNLTIEYNRAAQKLRVTVDSDKTPMTVATETLLTPELSSFVACNRCLASAMHELMIQALKEADENKTDQH